MDLFSRIALSFVDGLGNASIRRLVDLYPDRDVFSLAPSEVKSIFGSHRKIIDSILNKRSFARAEEELKFCEKNHIRPLFFTDPDYPARLNSPDTGDCPALLYCLGTVDLNPERSVAIVGTRRATPAGYDNTAMLVGDLKSYAPHIISGLAYGIDAAAHTAALEQGLPTVAVLGHGLDRIYPPAHRPLAKKILEAGGGLVTEYPSGTDINPRYFPARNRITAALADAVVVVESAEKGGSLITAAIAGSYHREVFAVPGRLDDPCSKGTNNLIATHRALLVRNARDIAYQLGWPVGGEQLVLEGIESVRDFSPREQRVVDALAGGDSHSLDELANKAGLTIADTASILFTLEIEGYIRTVPGNAYQLTHRWS